MKKITVMSIATVLGVFMFAITAMAGTTASITPASVNVVQGQQFNVVVSVNPQGTKNYAEKIEINYPADILEVSSFTLGNGWMALSQPGYDSVDNAKGSMVKTAGYAGGISSQTPFGTILFKAKKSGNGTIGIGSGSSAFVSNGQSVVTGTGSTVTINSVTTVVPPSTQERNVASEFLPTSVSAQDLAPVSTIDGKVVTNTDTNATNTSDSQVAAIGNVDGLGNTSGSSLIYWFLGAIVVIALAAYLIMRRKKSNIV